MTELALLLPEVRQQLESTYAKLLSEGRLPSRDQLASYYQRFRGEFGPEALSRLDGTALLEKMHDHSNHSSLVYWLEFKNDQEWPAIFGGIGGGSALKFRIYRRAETGAWMTGSPRYQKEMTVEEAVAVARTHRTELLAGVEILERLPERATDEQYEALQESMAKAAPNLYDLGWGHKYFSILFPAKLDDYQALSYQIFHLIKLLQMPPSVQGRYALAGRFVAAAAELDAPMSHLTSVLNQCHGNPYTYWRIGSRPHNIHRWAEMRDGGFIAIGWPDLGDLSGIAYSAADKDRLKALLRQHYDNLEQVITKWAHQIMCFCAGLAEGDMVVVATGNTVHGVGTVAGGYQYVPQADTYPHQRPVRWLSTQEWELAVHEGYMTTVHALRDSRNLVDVERRLVQLPPPPPPPPRVPLTGIPGQIQRVLERKGQVILYGPPGTGKTYWAEAAARGLAARGAFGRPFMELSEEERGEIVGAPGSAGLVRMCSFHPAYGYEDFIEGYRPETVEGRLSFVLRDGIFKSLCGEAARRPDRQFYLIIDEINRGDIPRIFGELLTVLEWSRRGRSAVLPLTRAAFQVPPNVFLIGTMNTADRSIALLDTALRRRFGFIELMPDASVLGDTVVRGVPLGAWLTSLNRRVREHIGRDARNLQIGHSYLMEGDRPIADFGRVKRALRDDVLPLLEEYCYGDYEALERILGRGLVDVSSQCYRLDLFEGRDDDLVQALLSPDPDVAASAPAVEEPEEPDTEEEDADDGADGEAP